VPLARRLDVQVVAPLAAFGSEARLVIGSGHDSDSTQSARR
jgi:hypothetical protein